MGAFVHCYSCRRLILRGQRCSCAAITPMACDCTYDGNRQIIGPECRQRIKDVWHDVVTRRSA